MNDLGKRPSRLDMSMSQILKPAKKRLLLPRKRRLMVPQAAIYDIDGTLCDNASLVHWIDEFAPNYVEFEGALDEFHRASVDCPPHWDTLDMLNRDRENGVHIVLLTARRERYFDDTVAWLNRNQVKFEELVMRPDEHVGADHEYKLETLLRLRQTHEVIRAADDRPSVIKLWREQNIPHVHVVPSWPDWHPEKL